MEHFESTQPFALQRFARRRTNLRWAIALVALLDVLLAFSVALQRGWL